MHSFIRAQKHAHTRTVTRMKGPDRISAAYVVTLVVLWILIESMLGRSHEVVPVEAL
jgi:hypothetical protein